METVTDLHMYGKMVGEIWRVPCKPVGREWAHYNLLVMEVFQTVKYGDCDIAAGCIILETGEKYAMYVDLMQNEGIRVS